MAQSLVSANIRGGDDGFYHIVAEYKGPQAGGTERFKVRTLEDLTEDLLGLDQRYSKEV